MYFESTEWWLCTLRNSSTPKKLCLRVKKLFIVRLRARLLIQNNRKFVEINHNKSLQCDVCFQNESG